MSVRAVCVAFLLSQLVCISPGSSSPYGGGASNDGHVGKKGPNSRYTDHYDKSRTSDSRTCSDSFVDRSNYIIRTKESLDSDATFIDAIKVPTFDACVSRCCDERDVIDDDGETVSCDAAVFVDGDDAFENKESNCFLFQCRFETGERNRCRFSNHDGYDSSMVGGLIEPEFEDGPVESEDDEEEIPQTKAAAPATTRWKTEDKKTDDNEEPECNNQQFKCDNGQCIRSSLVCDKYADCDDNSDEDPDRCSMMDGQGDASHNENENEPAKAPPTNPPKSPTTNNAQRFNKPATTNAPKPPKDDTIFSELASQLHKEGAKQKMHGKSDDENDDRQHGDWNQPDDDDWDDGQDNDIPQSRHDDDDEWHPRNKGRPYGSNYDRPGRLRQHGRYEDDKPEDSRDYQRKPVNNGDEAIGDDRGDDDGDRESYNSRYRGGGDSYDTHKGRYHPDDEKQDDSGNKYNKEDTSDNEDNESRNKESKTNEDKWDGRDDNKENTDATHGSGQQQDVSKQLKAGESTKEDWYGQKQPDKETLSSSSGRVGGFPYDDYNNRNDYHDYYYDRNGFRGYPNRYNNNYRNPNGPGGDYQNSVDYTRNQGNNRIGGGRGWGDGAGGRGRGNGGGRNWNQAQNRYSEGGHEEDHGDEASQEEADISNDKLQGLWKIWRYMYGSSAADYTTELPPVVPGDDNEEDDNATDDDDDTNDDQSQEENLPTTNVILNNKQDDGDITNKPTNTKKLLTEMAMETRPSQDQSNKNNSKTAEEKNSPSKVSSSGGHHDDEVRVVEKQGVTATAVLPLTIGLFLTLFLLLMMSCRLRYMNRRLRYGRLKTNNAHDADYLINGMYL
ncbi:LOW QUALITY PROTEIN: uncharacterized protein [Amphiura filiformis]|uniref:LOW QUALITY PROTEIN: uncharacterized protein n=1 Tax=Amphiura filiformis TaxID=82378 RepID=UPI003B20DBDF